MRSLVMSFRTILRTGKIKTLHAWMNKATASGIYKMQRFLLRPHIETGSECGGRGRRAKGPRLLKEIRNLGTRDAFPTWPSFWHGGGRKTPTLPVALEPTMPTANVAAALLGKLRSKMTTEQQNTVDALKKACPRVGNARPNGGLALPVYSLLSSLTPSTELKTSTLGRFKS
jgi:hypothetical protein